MNDILTMLYDGACPFCRREADWLKRRDRSDRLRLVDIADGNFESAKYGLTDEEVSGVLHAILPDGTVLKGMDAVREAYRVVGLGWILAPTKLPGVRAIFDMLYGCFARNRLALGRPFRASCSSDRCSSPAPDTFKPGHDMTK